MLTSEKTRVAPMRALGVLASTLVVLVALLAIAMAWIWWVLYDAAPTAYSDEDVAARVDVRQTVTLLVVVSWVFLASLAISGVVFMTWLWRARRNAESLCAAPHRRERSWVVWSWICPIAQFRYPYQVLDDVHRASRPNIPPDTADLREIRGSNLLGLWAALWAAVLAVGWFNYVNRPHGPDAVRTATEWLTVAAACMTGAAVTLVLISRWQDNAERP